MENEEHFHMVNVEEVEADFKTYFSHSFHLNLRELYKNKGLNVCHYHIFFLNSLSTESCNSVITFQFYFNVIFIFDLTVSNKKKKRRGLNLLYFRKQHAF